MKKKKITKPYDRKDVFILSFKQNYGIILGVSIAMLIFALPALAVFFGAYIELSLMGDASLVEFYALQTRMFLWLIPAFVILSIGAAGAFYVIRKLVWNEDVVFFKDLFHGIKINSVQCIISGLLFIIFVGAMNYGMNMLELNVSLGAFYWILKIVQIFLTVMAILLLLFQYCAIVVYNDKMFTIIKNSFALTWMSFPRSIGALLLAFLPLVLFFTFIQVYIIYIIAIVFMALVGFGYGILVFTLNAHHVFDKYINRTSFPDFYKKGLYHEGNTTVVDPTHEIVDRPNIDVE